MGAKALQPVGEQELLLGMAVLNSVFLVVSHEQELQPLITL